MVTAIAAASACRSPGGSEQFPKLEIVARYPLTGQFQTVATVCSGAEATLVSFDIDGDRGFEYRFLFNSNGTQLWGCGDSPCTGPIDGELPVPRRVMIEGITVAPSEYGNRRHDVACRGIADSDVGMGSIVVSPLAFPGLEDAIHAEVPMLRVGAFNGMFSQERPIALGMSAGLLVAPEDREEAFGHLRVATGGIVVAAGGSDPTNGLRAFTDVWEFRPWKIGWEKTATLGTGHSFGNAMPFLGENGEPEVLFVGGVGTNLTAVLRSDVYRRGEPVTEAHTQLAPRFFPGVARFETDDGDPAIAVLNGCWGATGGHGAYQHDYEIFYPRGAPPGCENPGPRGFCKANDTPTGESIEGRCQAAIGNLEDGRIWFGAGVRDDNQMSTYTYAFDPNENGGSFLRLIDVQLPLRLMPTVALGDDAFALYGGYLSAPGSPDVTTDRWVILHPETGALATGYLLEKRGFNTATLLLDGRVLVTGGSNGAQFLATAEIVDRGTKEIGGQSEFIAPAGRSTCVPGLDCEEMAERKYGQVATRIEGSATWLEGSVLLSGGSLLVNGTPELFVPAYHCDGTKPVNRLDGERVPAVELCDRLRDPPPVTDPRKPKRF